MADGQTQYNPLDYVKGYSQAVVAADLYQTEKGQVFVPSALKSLNDALKQDGPGSIYEEIVRDTPEAKQKLIQMASQRYTENKEKSNIGGLIDWYMSEAKGFNEEAVTKIKESLGGFQGKTIEDIKKKIGDAQYVLNPRTKSKDEEKEKAEKTIEDCKKYLGKIDMLEMYALEAQRSKSVNAHKKANLENLVK